jgi:hypothetical protein
LYYCVAGIGGSPTWIELTNVKNVSLSMTKGEADVTTQGNRIYSFFDNISQTFALANLRPSV